MAEIGSYTWWREHYADNQDFKAVCSVLAKWGVDCSEVEVDHFPPNAAYTGSHYESRLSYGARPAAG